MSDTYEDIRRIARALQRACDEHGWEGNSFRAGELHTFHNAPTPLRIGQIMRHFGGEVAAELGLASCEFEYVKGCFSLRAPPDAGIPKGSAKHLSPKVTMRYLDGEEIVDGHGLPLYEHASAIAGELNLDEYQVTALVSELRNALTPAEYWAARGDKRAAKGIRRVLELATAIAEGRRGRR